VVDKSAILGVEKAPGVKNSSKEIEKMDFLIGADPEFFLVDNTGEFRSAIDIIKGTKEEQLPVERGALQHDNVVAEFSCDPADGEEEFVEIIGTVLKQLSSHVKPLSLLVRASVDFPEKELDHPEAKQFGCDPDFCSWSLCQNFMEPGAAFSSFRSCGGHIHIGIKDGLPKILAEDDTGMGRVELTKAMDIFVGIPAVLMDTDPTSPARRKLYGRAGAHRPKEYGLEYRALGNFWTKSPDLVRMVYRLSSLAVHVADQGLLEEFLEQVSEDEVQRIINESDIEAAKGVVSTVINKHLKENTRELLKTVCLTEYALEKEWSLS